MLGNILMYRDLIRNELQTKRRKRWLIFKDDANIHALFSARRSCWLTVLKRVVGTFLR